MKNGRPSAYISITLHAHLPYVINHGTWPHGLEWLHEAAAETYLPLLRVLKRLERDGLALKANINLSPVLLEQLAHPTFKEEFPKYLERKILSAREDENYFRQCGESHFAETAWFWQDFFEQALKEFYEFDREIVRGFRHFNDTGAVEILTCAATHGYLPLLGTDESVTAQIATGVAAHVKHLGRRPRGIWSPECGYRPAGMWQAPVAAHGETHAWAAFERLGLEEAIAEAGVEYFFVDSHLVKESVLSTPYQLKAGVLGPRTLEFPLGEMATLYQPYIVDGPLAKAHPVTIFPRDPKTGLQVWSGENGYPGDVNYLDFHKKRWPGGHRYWQVTAANSPTEDKTPYYPGRAQARTRMHAEHFVKLICDALKDSFDPEKPPVLVAPFDAELFGHWWFEGPMWLERVVRILSQEEISIALTTASEYLDRAPARVTIPLNEGSWGKNGGNDVWLNPETAWTWEHIYQAERAVRAIATEGRWRGSGLAGRIVKQLVRELLLLESSDWQFLITTAAARDYAEMRFSTHLDHFHELESMWAWWVGSGGLSVDSEARLGEIEERDSLFADVDPGLWAERA